MSAYIYDAVRTPRGKGKPDGALASVKPVDLLASTFDAIRDRNKPRYELGGGCDNRML